MLTRCAGKRVVGLDQHNADLQPAHSGLPQYRVVQQVWTGITVRRVATVRLQHSASAMDRSLGTATVSNDARRYTADRVQ
jgi:hypothetical protein